MDEQKIQEHVYKEMLKGIVDESPNYTKHIKDDVKAIIDAGRSLEEICKMTLAYFATKDWE